MALGGGGAAAARVRRRRRPKNSPFTAAVAGPAEPPDADAMLDGLDLDAELRSILAQADGSAPEEVAETNRSTNVVSTPS